MFCSSIITVDFHWYFVRLSKFNFCRDSTRHGDTLIYPPTASGHRKDDGAVEARDVGEFPTIFVGDYGDFVDFGEGFDEVIVDLDFAEGVEVVSGEFRRGRLETLRSSHRMVFSNRSGFIPTHSSPFRLYLGINL